MPKRLNYLSFIIHFINDIWWRKSSSKVFAFKKRVKLKKKKKKKELSYSLLFVKLSSESVGILL